MQKIQWSKIEDPIGFIEQFMSEAASRAIERGRFLKAIQAQKKLFLV